MSELINRLASRIESDLDRRISFDVGMKHFIEFVREAMVEIEAKVDYIDSKLKRDDH